MILLFLLFVPTLVMSKSNLVSCDPSYNLTKLKSCLSVSMVPDKYCVTPTRGEVFMLCNVRFVGIIEPGNETCCEPKESMGLLCNMNKGDVGNCLGRAYTKEFVEYEVTELYLNADQMSRFFKIVNPALFEIERLTDKVHRVRIDEDYSIKGFSMKKINEFDEIVMIYLLDDMVLKIELE